MHDNYLQEKQMYIIFGDEQAHEIGRKYTVLELDTVHFIPSGTTATAYAVVENIPIPDLPKLSFQKDLHCNLIENYRKRDWNFCSQAIENLVGNFGGELDTFYAEIQNRINNYKDNDPGENWDYMLEKADPLQS
jgi:hypothetical protein